MNYTELRRDPPRSALAPTGPGDLDACVELMRGGSKTFFAASRLLPAHTRSASIALYAFCRVADDLVDEGGDPEGSLARLGARLDAIYAGRPQPMVEDRALAVVVHRHQLPRPLLDALLEGFSWDAGRRTYETLDEVQDYAARVAGSVGAMMCWLMGVRSADALARACELGVAMQLTNIARDVGQDARIGRLYLPRQWLRAVGIDPEAWLAAPVCTPALQSVVERLLAEADRLYRQSSAGIAELPRECRPAIMAARLIYAEIGEQLRRDGLDPVQRRAVVPLARKLRLLASAWLRTRLPLGTPAAADRPLLLVATDYLVAHCVHAARAFAGTPLHALSAAGPRPAPARRAIGERAGWMLALFERQALLRRERKVLR